MRIFLLFCMILTLNLFGYSNEQIVVDYKAQNYKDVCLKSNRYKIRDENILSIIGDACAKADYINPLGYIISRLKSTPQFRENGSYFATLILQKKLIYQYMNDDIDLKNLRLPRGEHILSIVFENLVKKNFTKASKKITINHKDKQYKVWLGDEKVKKVHIDEYKNNKLIRRHSFF